MTKISVDFNTGSIGQIIKGIDLSHIKTFTPNSLFEVRGNFDTLIDDRCPWCNRKLRMMIKRPLVKCMSPRCVSDPRFKMNRIKYDKLKFDIVRSLERRKVIHR